MIWFKRLVATLRWSSNTRHWVQLPPITTKRLRELEEESGRSEEDLLAAAVNVLALALVGTSNGEKVIHVAPRHIGLFMGAVLRPLEY